MKTFSDYLIEKNILSTDQVVTALIHQTNQQLSMFEVAFRNKLMRSDELLNIIKIQSLKKYSFVEAAKEIGKWTIEIENEIEKQILSNRTPLTKIITELNMVNLETITKAFDDFLSQATEAELRGLVQEASQSSIISKNKTFETYLNIFDEDKKQLLIHDFDQFTSGGLSISLLEKLKANLQALNIAAREVKAMQSWSMLQSMEVIVDRLGSLPATKVTEELITNIGKTNLDAVELLWEFVQIMQKGTSEEDAIRKSDQLKNKNEKISASVELSRLDLELLV